MSRARRSEPSVASGSSSTRRRVPTTIVLLPASRALTTRFVSTCSSCVGSAMHVWQPVAKRQLDQALVAGQLLEQGEAARTAPVSETG